MPRGLGLSQSVWVSAEKNYRERGREREKEGERERERRGERGGRKRERERERIERERGREGRAGERVREREREILSLFFVFRSVLCEALDEPENGELEQTGNFEGSTAQYFCDEGFTPGEGDDIRTCTAQGEWSGTALTCQCTYHDSYLMFACI